MPTASGSFRLGHGVYGIRGHVDQFIIRVKLPYGQGTRRQWGALAACADTSADGRAHLNRPCVQYRHVPLAQVAEMLRRIGTVGLTNYSLADVCPLEVWDVRPTARALVRHMPRRATGESDADRDGALTGAGARQIDERASVPGGTGEGASWEVSRAHRA